VVGIDPAVTSTVDSCETGILVCEIADTGDGDVLEDLSGPYSPDGWARRAVHADHQYSADRLVAEMNNGSEMVEFTSVDGRHEFLPICTRGSCVPDRLTPAIDAAPPASRAQGRKVGTNRAAHWASPRILLRVPL
jgi:hypothetical protein